MLTPSARHPHLPRTQHPRLARALATLVVGAAALVTVAPAGTAASVTPPPVNAGFDYQIGGAYTPPAGVTVVSRDREAKPAAGLYSICYVNAFQVQPGELEWWEENHPDLLLRDDAGEYVVDGDWEENLLDVSTAAKRTAVAAVVGEWIDGCAADGFQAVEPDNIDSYDRSEGQLTRANALAYLKLLIARAHTQGLAIGQKNTAELGTSGKKAGLDFAIVEECGTYDECGDFTDVYGAHVIAIEYTKAGFQRACKASGASISVVRRNVDVSPRGSRGYVYGAC